MDLKKYAASESGTEMKLQDPSTGQEIKGVSITLVGFDSAQAREKSRELSNRRLKKKSVTSESIEADSIELLVACTVAWTGIDEGGEVVKCTTKNVKRIYEDYPFIREQVDEFVGDRSNFLGK